jgi:hypothetical protein
MRVINWYSVMLILFISNGVLAQKASLCEKIGCSNHGTCVEVKEQPVCSCDEGYIADTKTSLTCIPYEVAMKLNEEKIPPARVDDGDEELFSVERALKKHNLDLSYKSYKKKYPHRPYAWLWHERYSKQMKIGKALMVGSIFSTVISVWLFSVGLDLSDDKLIVAGIVSSASSGLLLATGIPLYVAGKKRVTLLNGLIERENEKKTTDDSNSSRSFSISIDIASRGMSMTYPF